MITIQESTHFPGSRQELLDTAPRDAHATWRGQAERADPIGILHAADAARQPDLVPLRYGRMLQSPFHSIFFTSKLIFEHDNWYIRQLHSEAALTMLRRLHLRNMPIVILPMKL
jgi:hypothetical protein